MDRSEISKLKQDIDLLIKGTDPQSQIEFGKDSVLNSAYNTELLNKVSFILEYILKIGMEPSVVDKRKTGRKILRRAQRTSAHRSPGCGRCADSRAYRRA